MSLPFEPNIELLARVLHVSPDVLRDWIATTKLDLLVTGTLGLALRYTWVGLRNLLARLRSQRHRSTEGANALRCQSHRRHRDSPNQGRLPF